MQRRRALTACVAALTCSLGGCSSWIGGSESETAAETPTQTPTPTPAPTPTARPTLTAPGPTHELGESFTVGEGADAIRYTVHRILKAKELGAADARTTQDLFFVVELTVENLQPEVIWVPTQQIALRAVGVLERVSRQASVAAESDSRLDVDSLTSQTVIPDGSVRGVVVFDAPPVFEYQLEFVPIGSDGGPNHYVPFGLADVEPLPGG